MKDNRYYVVTVTEGYQIHSQQLFDNKQGANAQYISLLETYFRDDYEEAKAKDLLGDEDTLAMYQYSDDWWDMSSYCRVHLETVIMEGN